MKLAIKKILIVDDSRAMQTIVSRGIQAMGYSEIETRQASDGAEALSICRTWEPELVLCDWHMPGGMSGLDLLHALNREMLGISVGFVTTEEREQMIQEAMDAGAKFIVNKPFDFATLHKAVLPIIQGQEEGEEALSQHQPQEDEPDRVALPNIDGLTSVINNFTAKEVLVERLPPIQLTEKSYPCVVSLFESSQDNVVRAIAVMDVKAACLLGGAVNNIDEDDVHVAIAERAISRAIMQGCERLLSVISVALHDTATSEGLVCSRVHTITETKPVVKKLFSKPGARRIDVEVGVIGYETGRVTIIVA
jgi:CheY-like chemotaxis protein